ncbi:MAG: hypothetical protein ACFCUR_20810 [Rhodomicrobiaceae bacterium]
MNEDKELEQAITSAKQGKGIVDRVIKYGDYLCKRYQYGLWSIELHKSAPNGKKLHPSLTGLWTATDVVIDEINKAENCCHDPDGYDVLYDIRGSEFLDKKHRNVNKYYNPKEHENV